MLDVHRLRLLRELDRRGTLAADVSPTRSVVAIKKSLMRILPLSHAPVGRSTSLPRDY